MYWLVAQKDNIVILNIDAPGKPRISMGTEAGIIGKHGINSSGVGVCANGISLNGVNYSGTPVHICRRLILESTSREEAIAKLEKYGTAAANHMLVGDTTGCVGLECTTSGIVRLPPDTRGRVMHTNHLLVNRPGEEDLWLPDSPQRLERLKELADKLAERSTEPTEEDIAHVFADEKNLPFAINRMAAEGDPLGPNETLFNIVMDLTTATAYVKVGRPTEAGELIVLKP